MLLGSKLIVLWREKARKYSIGKWFVLDFDPEGRVE